MSAQPDTVAAGDAAERALGEVQARARAEKLLVERRAGRPWLDVVTGEQRPLIVERISTVLAALSTAGHTWRREQAAALQSEQVSINRIAALFGVTRQRISALLKEDGAA
jgi:transcription antitermination factor NusA-like protein